MKHHINPSSTNWQGRISDNQLYWHELVQLVADLATRVIFIADGEKVADGSTLDVLLSSPAFAPQVAKVMSPHPWLRVSDVTAAIEKL
jgi:hypothetical protein